MLRSNVYAETIPDIKSLASVLAPAYTGYYIQEQIGVQGPRYLAHKILRRTMCSCGYESSMVPEESIGYYDKRCPHCGGTLFNLSGGYYSSPTNSFSANIYTPRVKGNLFELYLIEISAKPILTKGTSTTDIENLKSFTLEYKETLSVSITKNAEGFTFNSKVSPKISTIITKDVEDFFGDWVKVFRSRNNAHTIDISPNYLMAQKAFPNTFSPENAINYPHQFGDALLLFKNSLNKSYSGKIIPRDISLEDFFDQKGFPKEIFPLNFEGRSKIRVSYPEIKKASKGEIGKILFNRIQNGQSIYSHNFDMLVKIQLQIMGEKYNVVPEPEIFPFFFRDAIDHFGFDEKLDDIYKSRYEWLRANGYIPSEDTIRTRTFSSLKNGKKFSPKKDIDVIKAMSENPLEAFKTFKAPK